MRSAISAVCVGVDVSGSGVFLFFGSVHPESLKSIAPLYIDDIGGLYYAYD